VVQRDPMDNIVLECAVAGEAASIVTGDEHLLGLHSFRSITICTPATFQSILRSTHP
jgi:predicted nucleic acid-binding protein